MAFFFVIYVSIDRWSLLFVLGYSMDIAISLSHACGKRKRRAYEIL
jgi:hypothetical protein